MKKSHVALTKCFYCGESDRILLAKNYRRTKDGMEPIHDLEPLNGKAVDMEPCKKCSDLMAQGIILLGIDSKKSDPGWEKEKLPNPWRTGEFIVIKEEAFDRVFDGEEVNKFAHKHRFMFIERDALVALGLAK